MTIKDIKQDVEKLYDHAKIANEEMGVIKNDIAWIKEWLVKMDTRLWMILATIVIGFLANIYFK